MRLEIGGAHGILERAPVAAVALRELQHMSKVDLRR